MTEANVARLFPAFAMRSRDFRRGDLPGYEDDMAWYLERAATVIKIDERKFQSPDSVLLPDPLEDDLQAHYICYLDNCAVARRLRSRVRRCDYVAGYSMGVFSAIHDCGSVSFEDGLLILHHICSIAHRAVGDERYGMGVVMGLTIDEVVPLKDQATGPVEIADICGPRVVIFSGHRRHVEEVLDAAVAAGALQARLVPVRLPFHSTFLRQTEEPIRQLIKEYEIRRPKCPLVSSMTQQVLTTADDVREEIVRNVAHPMNWYQTMRRLLELGVGTFFECGVSDSLRNLAHRNVKAKYTFYTAPQFDAVPNSAVTVPVARGEKVRAIVSKEREMVRKPR